MKIAIAGYGIEGRASYDYFLRQFPEAEIVIVDERNLIDAPTGVQVMSGEAVFEQLIDFDLVVRTPQVAPSRIKTNGKIWSATNEFFAKCPAPIIGVTGTKGKGTTCSLITSILSVAGKKVHLLGNIGVPSLEILPEIQADDVVVYELSSFQLWDLEKSPKIAVVLMIEPDHLDRHVDFEDYLRAKTNIAQHQASEDVVIYHPTNQYSQQIALTSKGQKQRYAIQNDGAVYVRMNNFFVQENTICSVEALHLVGAHNQENACAAISTVLAYDPEVSFEAVQQGLMNFRGLDHRLKFVTEKNGVKYYDDSIATTPGSALAAIRAFDAPKVLLCGGKDKGGDYAELAQEIVKNSSVRRVVLYGENAPKINQTLATAGVDEARILRLIDAKNMMDVVSAAKESAQSGDVVILSPAAASLDMFESYQDRGQQFIAAVEAV